MLIVYPDAPASVDDELAGERGERLRRLGRLRTFPGPCDDVDEFTRRVGDARAILLGWSIADAVLERAPALECIAFTGIGVAKFVNLALARQRGITVTNTPGYADATVAEHTLALMLAAARHVVRLDRDTRAGGWSKSLPGVELGGKVLGLVGFGGIARRTAVLASAFGMQVLAWTRNAEPARAARHGVRFAPLDEVLARADVVSVHVAHTPDTDGLLNAERLDRMRPGALLVNTARGEIVDQAALVERLASGRLGGAALDVFTSEPLPPGHPLCALDNVVLTPHTAYNTPQAAARILDIAIGNIEAWAAGRPVNVVT